MTNAKKPVHAGVHPDHDCDSGADCHCGDGNGAVNPTAPVVALVGSPNAGKTSVYNALTGLHAKTGNYPGVTVSRSRGTCVVETHEVTVEDLPGTYSLQPISPDEEIVHNVLSGEQNGVERPQAVVLVIDSTTLRRSMNLLAEVLSVGLPTCLAVTMTDELSRRGGGLDIEAFGEAVGVPAVRVIGHRGIGIDELREQLIGIDQWRRTPLTPPSDPVELAAWSDSILEAADYRPPHEDPVTRRLDAVFLHPLWGTLVFLGVMFLFFQAIFVWAEPFKGWLEDFFGWAGASVHDALDDSAPLLAGLLADGVIGGVGAVLSFFPQIVIMFLLISLLEGVGYMARAAFLMDKVMSKAGLEGRAFVAMLSSVACAIPGVMATRTLPNAKDRLATIMAAPLMTCSARLPVYIIMVGLLVPNGSRVGPFSAGGFAMFLLYLGGTLAAMIVAWVVKKITDRGGMLLPFYMEIPPYRLPRPKTIGIMVWDSCKGFLRKAGTIILTTTVVLWVLLNVPMRSDDEFDAFCAQDTECTAVAAAVEAPDNSTVVDDEDGSVVDDPEDLEALLDAQRTAYTMDNSAAAAVGRFLEPVFAPLGFDWRLNVGVVSSLAARETFVATLGQIAAAEDPEEPVTQMESMTYQHDTVLHAAGDNVFNPATISAVLVFFMFAMQCMATAGAMRRETGTWKWPVVAYGYMFALAWGLGALTHTVVALAM